MFCTFPSCVRAQVRCSLEDVADNMFSTMRARGEKEMKIVRDVTETLKKTGASASVVGATIMPPLKELTGKREVYKRPMRTVVFA
jgi:hypothetical protein